MKKKGNSKSTASNKREDNSDSKSNQSTKASPKKDSQSMKSSRSDRGNIEIPNKRFDSPQKHVKTEERTGRNGKGSGRSNMENPNKRLGLQQQYAQTEEKTLENDDSYINQVFSASNRQALSRNIETIINADITGRAKKVLKKEKETNYQGVKKFFSRCATLSYIAALGFATKEKALSLGISIGLFILNILKTFSPTSEMVYNLTFPSLFTILVKDFVFGSISKIFVELPKVMSGQIAPQYLILAIIACVIIPLILYYTVEMPENYKQHPHDTAFQLMILLLYTFCYTCFNIDPYAICFEGLTAILGFMGTILPFQFLPSFIMSNTGSAEFISNMIMATMSCVSGKFVGFLIKSFIQSLFSLCLFRFLRSVYDAIFITKSANFIVIILEAFGFSHLLRREPAIQNMESEESEDFEREDARNLEIEDARNLRRQGARNLRRQGVRNSKRPYEPDSDSAYFGDYENSSDSNDSPHFRNDSSRIKNSR